MTTEMFSSSLSKVNVKDITRMNEADGNPVMVDIVASFNRCNFFSLACKDVINVVMGRQAPRYQQGVLE